MCVHSKAFHDTIVSSCIFAYTVGHQSPGYGVFIRYYDKIMDTVTASNLSHYFVSERLLAVENHEKITEPTISKQQANALLFSKVKDSLEQEGNADHFKEALKIMKEHGDGATKRLSREINTKLSQVKSNQHGMQYTHP